MLSDILKFYIKNKCSHLVFTQDTSFALEHVEQYKEDVNIEVIHDVRSATFFAYGEAKLLKKPVILVVKSQYLTHCYSGLTEAWFQRVPLIVISLAEDETSIYYEYLLPCIRRAILIKDENATLFRGDLEDSITESGPTLINLVTSIPQEKSFDCKNILDILDGCLSEDDTVIYYGCDYNDSKYKFKTISHNFIDKYAMISKYLGYTLGCNGRCILIIPMKLFNYDTNIFNNRCIGNKFKVIFIRDKDDIILPQSWIENNQIEYSNIDTFSLSKAQILVNTDKPMVIISNMAKEQ